MLKKVLIGVAILVGLYGLVQLMPSTQSTNETKSWKPYAYDLAGAGNRTRGGLLWEIMPQDVRFAAQSIEVRRRASAGLNTGLSFSEPTVSVMNCEGSGCVELRIPSDRYESIRDQVQENWSWIDAAINCVDAKAWCGVSSWAELEAQYNVDAASGLRAYMADWDGKTCAEVQHCRDLTALLGPLPDNS